MPEVSFPKPVTEVIATLADIFRHQSKTELVEVCESAHARFDETNYDNWNGGTYTWALRLEIPIPLYSSIDSRLSTIEQEIGAKLAIFERQYPNNNLGEVTISPVMIGSENRGQRMAPSDAEVQRLWPTGRFRLFLSHLATCKVAVSKLKQELSLRGVSAFVAHEDIEPSLEWRNEIELGLRSMHALASLLTSGFRESQWTDQEIGWALGRGVLVLPVRLGIEPYGFGGKNQGVSGTLNQPAVLAAAIVDALLTNPQTHGEMRRSLVTSFEAATSYQMAKALRAILVDITDFTEDERTRLRQACTTNSQVSGAFGVPETILRVFGGLGAETSAADVPF